mmetsp:Transcript_16607/g.25836  ORF Transcript_16607/g.25836 Transcript_16607/m.25836 type:complete len:86 (-) Transcript_16607:54-311(-)
MIEIIEVNDNRFHGDLDLTSLPTLLVSLAAGNNAFDGTLTIGLFPEEMCQLKVKEKNAWKRIVLADDVYGDSDKESREKILDFIK